MFPSQLKIRDEKFLYIKWNSGEEKLIKLTNLRKNCPCAECKAEYAKYGEGYIPIYSNEQVSILTMNLAGNYAINVEWKDGHNSGIYEFRFLNEM